MATQLKNKKEPIRIRQKKLANGNISLYLDIYINGKREYEFLKMYLVPEKSREDKLHNQETIRLANAVKALRIVDIQNGRYGFSSQFKLELNFFEYFDACIDARRRADSNGNVGNWLSARKHLLGYFKPSTTFADIDERSCEGFKRHLERDARTSAGQPLSTTSQHSYFCKFKACITQAFKDRIIPTDVCSNITPPSYETAERVFLTADEVRAMARTECRYPVLKSAFLFSCLTGLRWSDIQKLTWREISESDGHTRITFTQKKTRSLEYLDINEQAVSLLGSRRADNDRVFVGLKYSTYMNVALVQWALRAGITKDVTFHSGRHTFAVMMLDLGADIYTVQKLMGHKELRTTQLYAKILDKKKRDAVSLLPKDLL